MCAELQVRRVLIGCWTYEVQWVIGPTVGRTTGTAEKVGNGYVDAYWYVLLVRMSAKLKMLLNGFRRILKMCERSRCS